MKTKIWNKLVGAFLLIAFGAAGQGTIVFNNNVPGVVVTHVYYDYSIPARFIVGNGPNDTPSGFQNYSSMVPFSFGFAQLFAAEGADVPDWTLRPASPITRFRLGSEAGFVEPLTATLDGIPADAEVATLQLRVWHSGGGELSWFTSVASGFPHGASPAFNVFNIGGDQNEPPYLVGLQSFSFGIRFIPEPSPVALMLLGTVAWWGLARLRRSREGTPGSTQV